jgi:hypothetical protein
LDLKDATVQPKQEVKKTAGAQYQAGELEGLDIFYNLFLFLKVVVLT